MSNFQSNVGLLGGDNVQLALSIPLVLEKIIAETDNNSLYNSRLVSSFWNEAALSIFPKRPIKGQKPRALDLNRMFEYSDLNPHISDFDIRLLKSVKFSDKDGTSSKFLQFWSQNSNKIDALRLDVSDSFASTFATINTNVLKVLSIKTFISRPHQTLNLVPQLSGANLHTIEYHNCFSTSNFHSQMQTIIYEAVNLKRLKLKVVPNFIPNLNNNQQLQYLSYYSCSIEHFNHEQVSAMLWQVKDSLETLKLMTTINIWDEESISDPWNFDIPKMPKLKKFVNKEISLQPLDKGRSRANLFQILDAKFPSLKHLKLRDLESGRVQILFDQLEFEKPQNQIVSLRLKEIKNPRILGNFKQWFPNLRNLDLYLSRPTIQEFGFGNNDPYFGVVFSKFKDLRLKKFIFRMDWKFVLSDLVVALRENTALFEGLSLLELHTKEHLLDSMVDDLVNFLPFDNYRKSFCDWLEKITKTVNYVLFNGFLFSGETSWELINFIRSNNLPVTFKNENNGY